MFRRLAALLSMSILLHAEEMTSPVILYQNSLKNQEFGKEDSQQLHSEQMTVAQWQDIENASAKIGLPCPPDSSNFSTPEELSLFDTKELLGARDLESISLDPIALPMIEPAIDSIPKIKKTKSPFIATILSSLLPGLGHYYLGEARTASELLGGTLLGGAGVYLSRKDPYLFMTSIFTMQAVASYSVFAAYRDTKLYNGAILPNMPREDFKRLAAAPFQWSVLKKPEVWGGFLGALTIGSVISYFTFPDMHIASVRPTVYVLPLSALPIAIGEESMFRGFLQTVLSDSMPAWGAITLSSMLFGAAHIPNAMLLEPQYRQRYYLFSLPFVTGLGAYMGWMTHKNRSLKESVALHMWYDFTLMGVSALASTAAIGLGGPALLHYCFEF